METVYVYFVSQQRDGRVKIGVSSDPDRRVKEMQTGNAKPLTVIARFPFPNRASAMAIERELHEKYSRFRVSGEWFRPRLLKALRVGGKRLIGGSSKRPQVGAAIIEHTKDFAPQVWA
jgi:predicted GIY-YIG superfamily endonuclease